MMCCSTKLCQVHYELIFLVSACKHSPHPAASRHRSSVSSKSSIHLMLKDLHSMSSHMEQLISMNVLQPIRPAQIVSSSTGDLLRDGGGGVMAFSLLEQRRNCILSVNLLSSLTIPQWQIVSALYIRNFLTKLQATLPRLRYERWRHWFGPKCCRRSKFSSVFFCFFFKIVISPQKNANAAQWCCGQCCRLGAKRSWVRLPVRVFLCRVCMYSLFLCGFSQGTPASSQSPNNANWELG